jgi:hypothetical protein
MKREPSASPGWSERFLNPTAAAETTEAEALARGHSVILVTVATSDECQALITDASGAVVQQRSFDSAALKRTDLQFQEALSFRVRLPICEGFTSASAQICDTLLLRALDAVATNLPTYEGIVFPGECLASDTCSGNSRLTFSKGEPAVNMYTAGGGFQPHEDKQSLTILMPLSNGADTDAAGGTCKDFVGGGTAFWTDEATGPRPDEPTFVLRPPAGTAMLFGGAVMHAGQTVLSGKRCVFVASFSPHDAPGDWGLRLAERAPAFESGASIKRPFTGRRRWASDPAQETRRLARLEHTERERQFLEMWDEADRMAKTRRKSI